MTATAYAFAVLLCAPLAGLVLGYVGACIEVGGIIVPPRGWWRR